MSETIVGDVFPTRHNLIKIVKENEEGIAEEILPPLPPPAADPRTVSTSQSFI